MMRPATKKLPKTYPEREQTADNGDMMISGTSTSTPGVPRYKSLKSNIHEDEANELGQNAGKFGKSSARGSDSKNGGLGSRKHSNSGSSLTKVDKQKNQPSQKKSTVTSR